MDWEDVSAAAARGMEGGCPGGGGARNGGCLGGGRAGLVGGCPGGGAGNGATMHWRGGKWRRRWGGRSRVRLCGK
jgi:hypothetical protein